MDRYALRDIDPFLDGEGTTWWLYFETSSGTPHVGGEALEQAVERGWWRVPAWVEFDPATSLVELVGQPGTRVVEYRRTRVVEGYPDTLTPEDYHQRTIGYDEDEGLDAEADPLVRHLYEAVAEPTEPTRKRITEPWFILDGAPPPADGFQWEADLPYVLRHQPQYRHLFPGRFAGFRAALQAALEEVPGVVVYGASGSRVLSVNVRLSVPKLAPPEKWAKRPHLDGLAARDRKKALEAHNSSIQQIVRQLEIPASDYVQGRNRAEARALWDETIADVVEYVRDVVAQKCPTCGGRGFVDQNHEED